jgi:hypothetical protein
VGAKLALLSFVKARIILKVGFVRFTIRFTVEGKDRNGRHFAVARSNAEIPGNIFTCALGAFGDPASDALLCRRIGIKRDFAVDAFTNQMEPHSLVLNTIIGGLQPALHKRNR